MNDPCDYNDVRNTIRWMRDSLNNGPPRAKTPDRHNQITALSFALIALERQESVRKLITRWNYREMNQMAADNPDALEMERRCSLRGAIEELGAAWNCQEPQS